MPPDLNALTTFALVAEHRSFRAAADRLGVSRPAVSQTLRRLEEAMGIALLVRTTRSVALTEAGERLYVGLRPALTDIDTLLESVGDLGASPKGVLRLAVTSIAESFLSGPFLASFSAAYPEIALDITVTDDEFDIVAAGYDAGVRLGEVIDQDMIALAIAGDERQLVVASPGYLEHHGIPLRPSDLVHHRCIGWRQSPEIAPYRWEFAQGGHDFSVAVSPVITTNDMALMIKLARAGGGLTIGMEKSFRPSLESGELISVLEPFCPYFPGFYLYYSSRKTTAPKMAALISHLKAQRPLMT